MDRTEIKKTNLDILSDYRAQLREKPRLRQFFMELTLRCNEACFHCGSGCGGTMPDGLPVNDYKKLLNEIKDSFGTDLLIAVTGGEPLLYPDFFELMAYVRGLGFRWGMTSNATLITPEVAAGLRETGMRTISISIDGTREVHDRYRGKKGAYDEAMAGIQNLIDEDFFDSIMVTTVVNHENIALLDELFSIFDGMDINEWRLTGLEPIGRALNHPDMLLTMEDNRRMFDFIRAKREQGLPVTYGCTHFVGLEYEAEIRDWYFLCNAGVYVGSVMVDGSFGACLDIPRNEKTIQGNIYHDSFTDVWNNRYEFFRTPLSGRCRTCAECSVEKWCSGGSYHSWNFDKDEPYVCLLGIDKTANKKRGKTF